MTLENSENLFVFNCVSQGAGLTHNWRRLTQAEALGACRHVPFRTPRKGLTQSAFREASKNGCFLRFASVRQLRQSLSRVAQLTQWRREASR